MGTTLVYTAAPGEANVLQIKDAISDVGQPVGTNDPHVDVNDSVAITAGNGCSDHVAQAGAKVRCEAAGVTGIRVDLADGNDKATLAYTALPVEVLGGPGDDELTDGGANDTVDGGDGNDLINRTPGGCCNQGFGNDTIRGGAGNDDITGGNGDDTVEGGPGADKVYGDGSSAGADIVDGGDDADVVNGGPGNDTVRGGAGDDDVTGLNGNDSVDGGQGNDKVGGDADDDVLTDAGGFDSFDGGSGNDVVTSRDGVANEPVACGAGADRAIVDTGDIVATSDPGSICEAIEQSASTSPPPAGTNPGTTTPGSAIGPDPVVTFRSSQSVVRQRALLVSASCTQACAIKTTGSTISIPGAARVYRLPVTVKRLAVAGKTRLKISVPRKVLAPLRRALAGRKRVTARLVITANYPDGRIGGPIIRRARVRR